MSESPLGQSVCLFALCLDSTVRRPSRLERNCQMLWIRRVSERAFSACREGILPKQFTLQMHRRRNIGLEPTHQLSVPTCRRGVRLRANR
jgi:hypothetical protein